MWHIKGPAIVARPRMQKGRGLVKCLSDGPGVVIAVFLLAVVAVKVQIAKRFSSILTNAIRLFKHVYPMTVVEQVVQKEMSVRCVGWVIRAYLKVLSVDIKVCNRFKFAYCLLKLNRNRFQPILVEPLNVQTV